MEYTHEQAVADAVNVDFDVYRIRTEISEQGGTIDAGLVTAFRDRQTRQLRWEKLDEDVAYGAETLDRAVVAKDQIRTVIRAFKENLFTEIFSGRSEVPKTLIFAKDDSHADDIVQIVREEFAKGDRRARQRAVRGLRDESLEDSANLPPPDVIAREIVEDLEAALSEFAQIAESLGAGASGDAIS
jgi:type I restriction enzyme R subunit